MAFNINRFRGELVGGGAKSSLFQVTLTEPPAIVDSLAVAKGPFMIKSAALPGRSIATIEVPYFGRTIKVAGQPTFSTWTITIINDEDFALRNFFHRWQSAINQHVQNVNSTGSSNPAQYQANLLVTTFKKTGEFGKTIKIVGAYPTEIAEITLDWSSDEIMEFTVSLDYQWWEDVETTDTA